MVDSNIREDFDLKELLGSSKKKHHSTIPPPNLECLSPDYAPTNLQRVSKEGIVLSAGGLAILLQIANPKIAQGVNEYSNFAHRPIDRLRSTAIYVYCIAFGTSREKRAIIEKVHRAHELVKGLGYTADDPELQLWVAATLYVAGVGLYQKIFGDFDQETAEKVYREYAVMATALRVPVEMWPEDRLAFWEYWDEQISTLEISSHAKNVAKELLYNKSAPIWMRVTFPMLRLLTAEWLPARMREAYGLRTSKRQRRFYRLLMGVARKVYPRLPVFVREYPLRFYLKDMRQRMKIEERAERVERIEKLRLGETYCNVVLRSRRTSVHRNGRERPEQ